MAGDLLTNGQNQPPPGLLGLKNTCFKNQTKAYFSFENLLANTLTLDSGIGVAPGINVAPGTFGKNIRHSP